MQVSLSDNVLRPYIRYTVAGAFRALERENWVYWGLDFRSRDTKSGDRGRLRVGNKNLDSDFRNFYNCDEYCRNEIEGLSVRVPRPDFYSP
ncbi:hypothetical protein TNCV_3671341 [Trichonephila clavipes]|nr:hypothetical protein TNCV_3671341 [Trichonephila clavipes]